jgi:hypothetical protein
MKKFLAKVIGNVSGIVDGRRIRVPIGPCEIEDSGGSDAVKINWVRGSIASSVSISIEDYEQYRKSGDIQMVS